ncbi:hypothetical protein [Hymenobacter chitinivorans]|uniref:Uncharacterized protein n=1 Tax=Hymenobacter chitinivorans DSM 11115 TaxID=1121954 RepID=A0A2M9BRA2_9BACT|nr:hypothetical protein [Hymenobacter chitinivorans]PJJ60489.1 hypothetical protein CLV45_1918 [Hymenobacter chitinivorans DSM 11115]
MEDQLITQSEQLTEETELLTAVTERNAQPMPAAGKTRAAGPVKPAATPNEPQGHELELEALADAPPAQMSIVDQLYAKFVDVFGNSNAKQLFSLVWPGTTLDANSYAGALAYGPLPPSLEIAQSTLFDQYYPVATITQPDGTRVSDRYQQTIEHYGPVPNGDLLTLQEMIRQRLEQSTTATIDGKTVTMSLLDKFELLHGTWTAKREAWSKLKTIELSRLKAGGDATWWDDYITWYENNAAAYIDDINASYNRMIAEFPLNAFEDAIAILDTHDAAALLRAKEDIRNAPLPVPAQIGSQFLPAAAIPKDWGNTLVPSTKFTDLLSAPDAQQRYLDMCTQQLHNQIAAWNAVLAQMPNVSKQEMADALAEFDQASEVYRASSSKLITNYTAASLLAVKIFLQNKKGSKDAVKPEVVAETNALAKDMNPNAKQLTDVEWKAAAKDIKDNMDQLNADTGSMVAAGSTLGAKATAFLQTKVAEGLREIIAPVLAQLNSQLTILQQQIANLESSAYRAYQLRTAPPVNPNDKNPTSPDFPSTTDSELNRRWTEITMQVDTSAMATASTTSTSFSQSNWQVDLFFGSAGGSSRSASESFASDYLAQSSSIQIGMLATKVLIERPWMHPEIFNLSKKYFRVIDTPLTTPAAPPQEGWVRSALVADNLGGGVPPGQAAKNCAKINDGLFPAYPVALLLVKDVTIKIKCATDKTQALQSHSESNSSQGGGFLCFSTSREQSSSATSKSASSYSMAGDYVFRIPAPQVAGVWLQITPDDKSSVLKPDEAARIAKMLGFASKLKGAIAAGILTEPYPKPQV